MNRLGRLIVYAQLIRPQFAFPIILWVGSGLLLESGGAANPTIFVLGITMAFLAWTSVDSFNDYFGVSEDRLNSPERPIPSGKLAVHQVRSFALICLAFALVISLLRPIVTVIALGIILPVGYLYFNGTKRMHILGPISIGGLSAVSVVVGAIFVSNGASLLVLGMSGAVGLFHVGYNIHSSIKDTMGDSLYGFRTLPAVLGPARSGTVALSFMVVAVVLPAIFELTRILPLGSLIFLALYLAITTFATKVAVENPNRESVRRSTKLLGLALPALCSAFLLSSVTPLTVVFVSFVAAGQIVYAR